MNRMMKFYCQPLTAISDLNNNPHIPKDRMPIASGGGIVKLHFIHHFPAAGKKSSTKKLNIPLFGYLCLKTMNKMLNVRGKGKKIKNAENK